MFSREHPKVRKLVQSRGRCVTGAGEHEGVYERRAVGDARAFISNTAG